MNWDFKREESNNFVTRVPEGKHRIRVKSAEKAVSKNGNNMLALQFDVSGYDATLYHYIVFMQDRPEITNRMLTQFFDSFPEINEGELDCATWINKAGACVVKHEEYNGNVSPKISYFISADKQGDLPPWDSTRPHDSDFVNIPDGILEEEMPF